MLISLILTVMSVYRLKGGQLLKKRTFIKNLLMLTRLMKMMMMMMMTTQLMFNSPQLLSKAKVLGGIIQIRARGSISVVQALSSNHL